MELYPVNRGIPFFKRPPILLTKKGDTENDDSLGSFLNPVWLRQFRFVVLGDDWQLAAVGRSHGTTSTRGFRRGSLRSLHEDNGFVTLFLKKCSLVFSRDLDPIVIWVHSHWRGYIARWQKVDELLNVVSHTILVMKGDSYENYRIGNTGCHRCQSFGLFLCLCTRRSTRTKHMVALGNWNGWSNRRRTFLEAEVMTTELIGIVQKVWLRCF
jgi:hypothetical protein